MNKEIERDFVIHFYPTAEPVVSIHANYSKLDDDKKRSVILLVQEWIEIELTLIAERENAKSN